MDSLFTHYGCDMHICFKVIVAAAHRLKCVIVYNVNDLLLCFKIKYKKIFKLKKANNICFL